MDPDARIRLTGSVRSAFLSGLSATEWVDLNKGLLSEISLTSANDLAATAIYETVLSLLGSFHGNANLREYLRFSVVDPHVPVQLYQLLSVFLRSSRPPTMHDVGNLDMVCRLILMLHYDSHMPPSGSLVPYSAPPTELLSTISDALTLLRLSYDLPASPFHQLPASAAELVILLFSCVENLSSLVVSTTQVSFLLSQVHEVLQVVPLGANIRHSLDSFLLALSLLLGEGLRQVEETQVFANFQLTPRPDTNGPNPSMDLLTGTLILNRLVSDRALPSGSGTEKIALANLIAWFRISSQPLSIFYAHVLLSVVSCLGQTSVESDANLNYLWKSFLIGRIPVLLRRFAEKMALEPGFEANHSESAIQSAIAQVFTHHDLLDQVDFRIRDSAPMSSSDSVTEDDSKLGSGSIRYELLASLISAGLLDHKFAIELMVNVPPNVQTRISVYIQESASDVDTFIDSKFSTDSSFDDIQTFVNRVMRDLHSHAPFTSLLHSRFIDACRNHDIERLGNMCKVLTEHETLLEILTLHTPLYDMIAHSLAYLDEFDFTTVGDPQTAVVHIGEVVLFLQSTLARYRIHSSVFKIGDRSFLADQIRTCSIIYPPDSLSPENKLVLEAWRKAIFETSGDGPGIDDDILRSTKPKVLLSLSATLFSEAIDACISKKMDAAAFQNGLLFYTSKSLNWMLVGIVQALLDEVERISFQSPQHIKTLEEILSHKDCPSAVLRITRQQILRLYSDPKAQAHTPVPNMTSLVSNILKGQLPLLSKIPPPTSQNIKEPGAWLHEPRTIIRHALASADVGKVPTIDISRCLSMTNVRTFLDFTWRELISAADMGKIELCRRFATIILAPTSGTSMESATPSVPPLLPLFLHAYIPSLFVYIDDQAPAEQNVSIQLLAAIVVSALTFAAHFEKALILGSSEGGSSNKTPSSLPSFNMARKLRIDLRRLKNPSALALFQKLSASSTFISTFPSL